MMLKAIAGAALILCWPGAADAAPAFPASLCPVADAAVGLPAARIGPPDAAVLALFSGAGAATIAVHDLTAAERAALDKAFARLPPLHRAVLQRHLRRLTFLDLETGGGSALTSRVEGHGGEPQFDITFRASLLHESLTQFLNAKERRLFADDGSGFHVEFDAGSADALTYVLLHEASHVVDQVLGLTGDAAGPFRAGLWADMRTLAPGYDALLLSRTPFRRQPPVPLRHAPAYYESLRQSPFISFYATAAAPEDLAEVFAWQQLAARHDQSLTLTVRSGQGQGQALYRYRPLEQPAVQRRFADVRVLLHEFDRDCAGPS